MNFADELLNMANNHKRNKIDKFIQMTKRQFLDDIEGTAKIYSRDKGKEGYTVVKLKSGMFGFIINKIVKNILLVK